MKARISTTSLLVLLLVCMNLVTISNTPHVLGKEDNDRKDYREASLFYENFERRIDEWKLEHEGRWETIEFKTQADISYEGKKSLSFSAQTTKPGQSAVIKYNYDFTEKGFVIPLMEDTVSAFVWNVPLKHFSYIGIFYKFSNGKIGYYISEYYGSRINSSLSYSFVFHELEKVWMPHERNLYEDYTAVWGPPQNIDITGVGLVLADVYGTGIIQTAYYDMVYVGTEAKLPKEFSLSANPDFQIIDAGETAVYDVEVLSIGEYYNKVPIDISGLPIDAEVIFENPSGIPPFNSKMEIISDSSTPDGIYNLTISAKHLNEVRKFDVTLRIKSSTEVEFNFKVNPNSQLVIPGDSVKYNIFISTSGLSEDPINFSVGGLPKNCTSEFSTNPVIIGQDNEQDLTLLVSTGFLVTPGIYYLTITGKCNAEGGPICATSLVLIISGASLQVEISTDKLAYNPGETVHIDGKVDGWGISTDNVSISIQVADHSGDVAHIGLTTTDIHGSFYNNFTLGDNSKSGTYQLFITASNLDVRDAYALTSFVVGESSDPAIIIATIYSTDVNNSKKNIFSPGETVNVVLDINNGGDELNGIIWIEIEDDNGVPLQILMIQNVIKNTVKDDEGPIIIRISFKLSDQASSGSYSMRGYVSDKMISEGGKFLASDQGVFQVMQSITNTTNGV
ncbi:MAG: hypothetical protein NWF08_08435 [Candidatus Bathyarchaeota archaeon]|nr:hypothetical protein [Candidatus Bathyarchaeota archaeon]